VQTLDVERAQPFVDELRELRGQRRFLDVVFALEKIDRIRVARGDLLPNS